MKNKLLSFVIAFAVTSMAFAEVTPKSAAPDFTLKDLKGNDRKLSDFKGQWVVLEWFNKDCPFVKKHYGGDNMQALQARYTGKGVKWITINSSAPGNQGHESAADSQKTYEALRARSSFVLLDEKGVVGRLYGAKTTPHMYVISPDQVVAYAGAIDDNPLPDPKVIAKSKNYVAAALDAGLAGKEIAIASSKPYGCGVKY